MATDFPLPASEQIRFLSPSVLARPYVILRKALGVAIPSLLDLVCIGLACFAGILLYELHRPLTGRDAWLLWAGISLKYSTAFVILAHAHHLYTQRATLLQVADTARILRVSLYSLTLLSVSYYFTKAEMPRLLLIYFWAFATMLLIIQKYSTSRLVLDWSSLMPRQRRVLICGTTRETRRLFSYLLHSPHLGQVPVGFLDESGFDQRRVIYSHDYYLKQHAPVINQPLSESLLRSLDVQDIFVPRTVSQPRMDELLALATAAGVRVSLVGAGHPYFAEHSTSVQMIDGLMVTTLDADEEQPLPYIAIKRCIDVLLSSLFLLLSLPMWLIAAVLVKTTSRGPVFFRHQRSGQFGKPFVMLKFRSMYVGHPKIRTLSGKHTRSPRHSGRKVPQKNQSR
jgi:hypothetical protein